MNTTTTRAVSRWVILMLALGAGFSVASIYYAQPLLPLMGSDLHLSIEGMGMVPTLTQTGYALGILFLLPLGDRHDRRTLILIKSAATALFLLGCSLTGQLHSLLLTSLLIGMAATMAQDIVPAAAILAPEGKQGKTVGTVMTGLLLGILLSRTVSGVVGEAFGWRVMYQLAAASIAFIGVVMWAVLPRFAVHSTLSYPALMRSMEHLWRRYPALRRAALAQVFCRLPLAHSGQRWRLCCWNGITLAAPWRVDLVLPEPLARWLHRWRVVLPISWAPVKSPSWVPRW